MLISQSMSKLKNGTMKEYNTIKLSDYKNNKLNNFS